MASRSHSKKGGKLFSEFLDSMADAVFIADPATGELVDANAAAVSLIGLPMEQLIGLPFTGLHTPREKEKVSGLFFDGVRELSAGNRIRPVEIPVLRADGTEISVEITIQRLEIDGALYMVGVFRDISERKLAEAALKASEQKYRLLAERASDNIWTLDLESMQLTYTSPAVTKIQGFTVEEAMDLPLEQMLTPESLEKAMTLLQDELQRDGLPGVDPERESLLEWEEYTKDGSILNVEVRLSFLRDAGGRPTGLLGITRDVTERKRAEAALQESWERFRNIFDSIEDAIFIHDRDTAAILDINRRVCEMFGYSMEEALRLDVGAISANEEPFTNDEAVRRVRKAATGERQLFEWHLVKKSGELFWGDVSLRTVRLGEIDYVLATVRDITDRKRAEEEKRGLEMQFQQAQKLESVGRLAGGIAHDFNNLLTCITGNVSLSLLQLDPADPMYELLKDVDKAAENAAMLTKQLLAFSRKQIIEPTELDLNEYLEQMQKMLKRMIREDVVLRVIPERPLGRIFVDQGQLAQIIINLAVNASDAMPGGGTLSIKTHNITAAEAGLAREDGVAAGDFVMLEIADTGIGMPEDVKKHLFEPFFTTKRVGKGTGLGLATVYGAVRQSRGAITVESEVGKGTIVRIFLPAYAAACPQTVKGVLRADMPTGRETIYLVEDAPLVRDLAYKILTKLGYNVYRYPGGAEALAAAAGFKGNIDLLLTDVIMPGMSGPVLAERMVAARPGLRVLFTSGYTENEMADHGLDGGLMNFLGKPYTPETLSRKVREILDGAGASPWAGGVR